MRTQYSFVRLSKKLPGSGALDTTYDNSEDFFGEDPSELKHQESKLKMFMRLYSFFGFLLVVLLYFGIFLMLSYFKVSGSLIDLLLYVGIGLGIGTYLLTKGFRRYRTPLELIGLVFLVAGLLGMMYLGISAGEEVSPLIKESLHFKGL
ncbi:MAG: hypothetical protein IE916_00435 [Epsilonproteobacteria bacterium]|nr:hypothetical protein [Campylobacterota bacterium]